jgi:carbon-monoxide dehydrogenase large subunit
VTLSAAIHHASNILREKAFGRRQYARMSGDLELRNAGSASLRSGNEVTLGSVASGSPWMDHGRLQGMAAGPEETGYYEPPTVTWSYATHAAIVEVDVEIGRTFIENTPSCMTAVWWHPRWSRANPRRHRPGIGRRARGVRL